MSEQFRQQEDDVRKEEVETLFAQDGVPLDLPPIEFFLNSLATERKLPALAIGMCLMQIEEAGPLLRAVLTKAADGEALSEDEGMLVFRGLHILAGARGTETFKPLLRLLRHPAEDLDALLGDTVTETLARIVACVFDGDVDALFQAITDRAIGDFVRNALFHAATFLTWDKRIDAAEMQRFLERFYDEKPAEDGDMAWIGWVDAISMLGLRSLRPLVMAAWDEGHIGDWIMDRSHFEDDLRAAEQAPEDGARFEKANLGYIEDTLEALEWSSVPDGEASDQDLWGGAPEPVYEPVRNPLRHVGRNDPCPCGSGKKFKKCCLDK